MTDTVLSEKQKIERDYYNRIVHDKWDTFSLKVDAKVPPFGNYSGDLLDAACGYIGLVAEKRILEIGCGNGELSVWLAENGAEVWGLDISDESIAIAERRARENGVSERAHFIVGPGETTGQPDAFFDVVFIAVSLHHLIVEDALKEIRRVLKPSGVFVAIEPFVFLTMVQRIRLSRLVQRLYPERRETPTERILYPGDLQLIRQTFPHLEYRPYRIFSPFLFKMKPLFFALANMVYRREPDVETRRKKLNRAAERCDERLLRMLPGLRVFSRYIVFRAAA